MTTPTYMLWKYVRAFKGKRMIAKFYDNFEDVEKYIRANRYNMYEFSVDVFRDGEITTLMARNWCLSAARRRIPLNYDQEVQ